MKYCKDCKHFHWTGCGGDSAECHREPPHIIESPVYGIYSAGQPLCHSMRMSSGECGPEARFFEPKEKPHIE